MKQDIIFTADPQQMYGKYVAEDLFRKWKKVEEKTDKTDGHKYNAEVEKKELILKRGTALDSDTIQTVQFHITTSDITGVYCSTIRRRATLADPPAFQKPWKIQVENTIDPKKRTVILYAKTVSDAIAITTEYMERTYDGKFTIKSIGNFDNAFLLRRNLVNSKKGRRLPN